MSNQLRVFKGTILGHPVPFKDIENEESKYVVRVMLDRPMDYNERTILDIFVEVDPATFPGEPGKSVQVEGTVSEKQVITRSGKSGKYGVIHVKPVGISF